MIRYIFPLLIIPFIMNTSSRSRDLPVDWSHQFKSQYDEIQTTLKHGKFKSAFDLSTKLISQSIDSQNVPGLVLGMKSMIENAYEVEEDLVREKITSLALSKPENKVIAAFINSYMGELVGIYYERNRYRIAEGHPDEPRLPWSQMYKWTGKDYEYTIDSFYSESVRHHEKLQIPVEKAKYILAGDSSGMVYELRPFVYDLLQDRYVHYLKNPRLHRSTTDYVADQETVGELLSQDLENFLSRKNLADDPFYRVMNAWHNWEVSLKRTGHTVAWLDILLQRLNFVLPAIPDESNHLFEETLAQLVKDYSHLKNSSAISVRSAEYLMSHQQYDKALEVLENSLQNETEESIPHYTARIRSLIRQINNISLTVEAEEVYRIQQFPLIYLRHKNLDRAFLELYSVPEKTFIEKQFSPVRGKDSFQLHSDPIWQDTVYFPATEDYREHGVEVMIEENLDYGTYTLKYFANQDSTKVEGYVFFQVSDIGLMMTGDQDDSRLWVVDRFNGQILENAVVEMKSYRGSADQREDTEKLKKDNGGFALPPGRSSNAYFIVEYGEDRYVSPFAYLHSSYPHDATPYRRTVLFTDRAIYQPGDLIHFKALTTLSKKLTTDLLRYQKITVSLRDGNGQEVWSEDLRTDEWGSVTGTVPIPSTGLKGRWRLQASPSGSLPVQVEEYVRPNFEIKIDDENISRSDQKIKLKGVAATYSGFPVQSGQGKMEVNLEKVRWFYGHQSGDYIPLFRQEFLTDQEGSFEVEFDEAELRDLTYGRSGVYLYHIKINIRAESGEVREIEKRIPLDPDKMLISADSRPFYTFNDMPPLIFSVRNAMNTPGSMDVEWILEKLDAPVHYKVERYWSVPDQNMISEEKMAELQPQLFYDHGTQLEEWPVKKRVEQKKLLLKNGDSLALDQMIQNDGYYRLTIRSEEGDTLSSASFGITGKNYDLELRHSPVEIIFDRQKAHPGDTVRLKVFTASEIKGGIIRVARPDGNVREMDIAEESEMEIMVDESDRGGIFIHASGFLQGRYFSNTKQIPVPWDQKKLNIKATPFKDKLEVNSDNHLDINILNFENKGLTAEVAVVIYDASLDAYLPHTWTKGEMFFRMLNNPLSARNLSDRLSMVKDHKRKDYRSDIRPEPLQIPLLIGFMPAYTWRYSGALQRNMKAAAPPPGAVMEESSDIMSDQAVLAEGESVKNGERNNEVRFRDNFEELMLFRGKMKTDQDGNLTIPFQTNDKTGRWKVLIFAHTQSMQYGETELSFETSQSHYLEDFIPEILRQGDQIRLRTTLFNTTDQNESGTIEWKILSLFGDKTDMDQTYPFDVKKKSSLVLYQDILVSEDQNSPLIIQIVARDHSGKTLDAIEKTIPVLPASQTLHEGKVFVLKEGDRLSEKNWKDLRDKDSDEVEIRIVQNMYSELLKSIPYLHYNNPVTTDQYLNNVLNALMGQHIVGQIPDFEHIYADWKRKGELTSRLAQNEDKKYTGLFNTPWVKQSNSASGQMTRLALYFDKNQIESIIEDNWGKWKKSQNPDGGFPWIEGGTSSFYITNSLLHRLAKMKLAGIDEIMDQEKVIHRALEYLDAEFSRRYQEMKIKNIGFNYSPYLNYFITRSYFPEQNESGTWENAWTDLQDSIRHHWPQMAMAERARVGIAAFHIGDKEWSRSIANSFLDNAIRDSELGIYWKSNKSRKQTDYLQILSDIMELMIINEITELNEGMSQWVLVHKMTNDWHGNPNIFPLMISLLKIGDDFSEPSTVEVKMNGVSKNITGIGDMEPIIWKSGDREPEVNNIKGQPVWVGMIITRSVKPGEIKEPGGEILKINKRMIPSGDSILSMGDKVRVRLEIESDRDMDYVYIEDPLVAGFDPGINLSGWNWKQGLSFYQSFGHESVQLFIRHLPRGHYSIEYELGVVREGTFVHPATVIQSYFVPEIGGYDPWKSHVLVK